MKRCSQCGLSRPFDEYHRNKFSRDGRNAYCRDCAKGYRRRTYQRARATGAYQAYRLAKQPELRDRLFRKTYGISLGEYERLHEAQGGLCAICREPETAMGRGGVPKRLSVDHDHRSGLVRGLLCLACNRGIGYLRERPEVMLRAIDYLQAVKS